MVNRWRKSITEAVIATGSTVGLLAAGMTGTTAAEVPPPKTAGSISTPTVQIQSSKPEGRPVPTLSISGVTMPTLAAFDTILKCMDGLLHRAGVKDVPVTMAGIPDTEGRIAASRDQVAAVLLALSTESEAFRIIDFDTSQGDLAQLFTDVATAGASGLGLPTYYVRGTMTSRHAPWPPRAGTAMAIYTLDLHTGVTQTRTYVPAAATRLTLTLFEPNENGLIQGQLLSRDGWTLTGLFSTPQHLSDPAQTLVELGLVELIGKLVRLPYYNCLPAQK